jgi:broad specificity phosphatase PhoE
MRTLEIRRHTMRVKPGQHLSQDGVTLARAVGADLARFTRVITSTVPRAYETAIAMGFAVDEERDELSRMPDGVDAALDWESGFAAVARAIKRGGPAGKYARAQASLWRSFAAALPDGAAALVISHGGIIEAGIVGCLPDLDYTAWGGPCGYCEGARLSFDGDRPVSAKIIRVTR